MDLILIIVLGLVCFIIVLWIFWPRRTFIVNSIAKSVVNNEIKSKSMIGSFGTDLQEGTSQPSFKSSTCSNTLNPMSTDPSFISSKTKNDLDFDYDYDKQNNLDIVLLDPSWPDF